MNKENLKKTAYTFGGLFLFILLFNYLLMPWYVSGREVVVPKVIGLSEEVAKNKLSDDDLDFVRAGERYDEKYPKGTVIFQKPLAGAKVKEGRRIFLFISSGVPFVKVPSLTGKMLRDAKLTLERMDLTLGDTSMVESDLPKLTVIEQQYYTGREVKKGTKVNLTLSGGKVEGLISVPDLLGKSLAQSEKTILDNKLSLGRINYQPSFSLLPNTVIDQYPSKDTFVKEGTSIDLFVTKDVETPEEVEGKK
ncbi:MAG: PASTA domain-containing protein [Ignavibacteriales bacterium]|nr:PASTA domain-containing protein [Ignavibacteriales bacterium]